MTIVPKYDYYKFMNGFDDKGEPIWNSETPQYIIDYYGYIQNLVKEHRGNFSSNENLDFILTEKDMEQLIRFLDN